MPYGIIPIGWRGPLLGIARQRWTEETKLKTRSDSNNVTEYFFALLYKHKSVGAQPIEYTLIK